MLDPQIKALATSNNFAALAIPLADGQIMNHVMWVDATDDLLLINTEAHRAKYQAMRDNPNVTVSIWDAANPYSYAEVRGKVVGETRGDEARRHIDELAQRYMGRDYPGTIESERVIVKIEPVRQRTQ